MRIRRIVGWLCGALLLAVGLVGMLGAQQGEFVQGGQTPPLEISETLDETPDLWFVELTGRPVADGGSLAAIATEQASFRRNAARAGLKPNERYAFRTLFNGFSVRVNRSQVGALARIQGVKAIYPVVTIDAPPRPVLDAGSTADLVTALAMTGADVAQSELGFTGAGVKVGVMDTGIDLDHPDLGGDGIPGDTALPTARVKWGWDFVGDSFNADSSSPSYNPIQVPDDNPDDCNGHGSHVAGIIGADGEVKGVAPGVLFGAYRVFGCEGSTFSDIMLAAMERALADKMQVLNISIGSAYQWPQYPTAMAATRLVNKKVVVVASIGNNGANGLWAAGAPGVGDKVIGVASFDNTHATLPFFTISPDDQRVGYNGATGAPAPPTLGTFSLSRTGTSASAEDACSALPPDSLAGTVALIRRGTCSFYIKASNAQAAGAVGVVLYNNAPGSLNPTVAGTPAITIPVVAITQVDGNLIDARLAAGAVDLTWTDLLAKFPNSTGNTISSFSSYGLTPELGLKPDLGAPGGMIYSTYPLELGGYASLSGTSMASPHTAGAVALLLEAHPRTPSQAVRGILQNTAAPKPWSGNPALGYLDMVSRQGAGMLQIDDAILATTKIDPATLALGESEAGPVTRTLTIENNGAAAVTYDLSFVNALSTANTFTPAFYASNATVAFNAPSVSVAAGGTAAVDVTITAPTGPEKGQYGGYVVFSPRGGGQIYRVPFAGFVGDYQSIAVLTSGGSGFPLLGWLFGGVYYSVPEGWSYTMQGDDIPQFLVHLDHQSAMFRMEVFAANGKPWHRAYDERYLPRSSSATSFFAFPFDGYTRGGNKLYNLPNGTYFVKISILKALGDSANPAHWETWTSPRFVVDRP